MDFFGTRRGQEVVVEERRRSETLSYAATTPFALFISSLQFSLGTSLFKCGAKAGDAAGHLLPI